MINSKIKNFYQFRELFYLYMVFNDDDCDFDIEYLESQLKLYLMNVGVSVMIFKQDVSVGTEVIHDLDQLIIYFNNNNYI